MKQHPIMHMKHDTINSSDAGGIGQFFSEYIAHLFSAKTLDRMESTVSRHPVGLLVIQMEDFFNLAHACGEVTALRILQILQQEASALFERFFPACSLITLEAYTLHELLFCFQLPEPMIARLPDMVTAYRFCLSEAVHQQARDMTRQPLCIQAGCAWIAGQERMDFYRTLFRAFCDARFLAQGRQADGGFEPENICLLSASADTPPEDSRNISGSPSTIEELARSALVVQPDTPVNVVRVMLANQPPMASVIIVDHHRPVGLVMHYELGRKLGTRYGVSLYYHREVTRLMDRSPLIVEHDTPVEEVAKAAMGREPAKVYDDILVTREGVFEGTVSVQRLLDHLAEVQVRIAMGASPLTGLPGNVAIEQEINRRAGQHIASSMIYIDLDNFKVFNDVYGFDRGDKMLLFTATVIREAVEKAGEKGDFVGHVGGDDFMVISGPSVAEGIGNTITGHFEREIPAFYDDEDRRRGYIIGKGRDGVEGKFPFVSVSIGIIDCAFDAPVSMNDLSHRVAGIKQFAKSKPGNACVRDRRTPLGALDMTAALSPDEPA